MLFHGDAPSAAQRAWLARHRVPYVLVDPWAEPPQGAAWWARPTEGAAARPWHICWLWAMSGSPWSPPPLRGGPGPGGWREAVAGAGLPERAAYVRRVGAGEPEPCGARLRALELLDLPEPPTAVCVGSDAWVPGVYGALAERGLRVPDDLAVVGCGDLPEARWAVPGLTTVRRPVAEMAGAALTLVARLASGGAADGLPVELETELVVRSSTAPPGGSSPRAGSAGAGGQR